MSGANEPFVTLAVGSGGVEELANQTAEKRTSYGESRSQEKTKLIAKKDLCNGFQSWASALAPPACAKTFPPGPSDETLQCLQAMKNWSAEEKSNTYSAKEQTCAQAVGDHRKVKESADEAQGLLEGTFCSYRQSLTTAC
jgi:hypothetical protein